jgi:hypothetical protein
MVPEAMGLEIVVPEVMDLESHLAVGQLFF